MHPIWMCAPIIFLVAYILITRRTFEALCISTMYTMVFLAKGNFLGVFSDQLLVTITDGDLASIILLIVLMGSLIRLFTISGSINALRLMAEKRLKTGKSTLIASLLVSLLVSIDDYFCVMVSSACFMPITKNKRIPAERAAMVMSMPALPICSMNPIAVFGIFVAGLIAASPVAVNEGLSGLGLLVQSIPFNFSALLILLFLILLSFGMVPSLGLLKKADDRVAKGGPVTPPGSDEYGSAGDETNASKGKVYNIILPILVLVGSSMIAGTLTAGSFSVNVPYGILITFIFTFCLYCFRNYTTPQEFFNHIIFGMESMVSPIVILVIVYCFAGGLDAVGFSGWMAETVASALGGSLWILPAILFLVFTLIAFLFGSSWAMVPIGIPLALQLASALGGNYALFVGAIISAGLAGDTLCMYNGDMFFYTSVMGINPNAYFNTRLPYALSLAGLAFIAFMGAGLLFG
jgi:Na+/H+ antiporter NhaC